MPSRPSVHRAFPWLLYTCTLIAVVADSCVVAPFSDGSVNAKTLPASMITGLYGPKQRIEILDQLGQQNPWTWTVEEGISRSTISTSLIECMNKSSSTTEVKRAARGDKIVAIVGYSALVINYAPGQDRDKMIDFGVCLDGNKGALRNSHTLELLPDNLLAVATTGQDCDAGVWVYDAGSTVQHPVVVQELTGVRAIHGMVWDEQDQMLLVAGNTDAADGTGCTSYGIVQGYQYRNKTLSESTGYRMPSPSRLTSEWTGPNAKWWDGPHDLIPIPSTRMLLISTDRDIHAIDLTTGKFNNSGHQLATDYLRGFRPIDGDRRRGYDDVPMLRSDVKSLSLLEMDGAWSALYTQVQWRDPGGFPWQVNLLNASGAYFPLYVGEKVYRSRWFTDIRGWPTAK